MNDTLKVAGRIGAELGAAKAENEKLRGLLQQVVDCQAEHYGDGCGLHLSMITLAGRIKDALSQQPEPTDAFTAVDMATAAAQGFRDGQAAVEQAPAQDELLSGFCQWYLGKNGYAPYHPRGSEGAEAFAAGAEWQRARPAQTEQQPVAWMYEDGEVLLETDFKWNPHRTRDGAHPLYAAPIAQTAPQGTTSDKYRAELYDEVWGRARSMGYVNVTDALIELERMKTATQPEQSGLVEATLPAVRAAERLSSAIIHRMTDRQYKKVRAEFGDLQDALVVCRAALSDQGGEE